MMEGNQAHPSKENQSVRYKFQPQSIIMVIVKTTPLNWPSHRQWREDIGYKVGLRAVMSSSSYQFSLSKAMFCLGKWWVISLNSQHSLW